MPRSTSWSFIIPGLLVAISLGCATITPAATIQPTNVPTVIHSSTTAHASPTPLPVSPQRTLFLVDKVGRLQYRFMLFDVENKMLATQNLDFATTTWDVGLGSSSRFSNLGGSEFAHYNPLTKEIIFVLFPLEGGIAGWKPDDALPDPPFYFAIYKTSLESQDQFTQIYAETSKNFLFSKVVLNPQDNSLYMETYSYDEFTDTPPLDLPHHPEITRFDIATGQFEYITNTEIVLGGKGFVDSSDLRVSADGQKLYQLILYGDPQGWLNQTLYLKTINLGDGSVEYEEIISGDNINYSILALSADGGRIAYYTMDQAQNHSLWVKEIKSGLVKSIPLSAEIGNFQISMTDDGNKILVGFRHPLDPQGIARTFWEIYDLDSDSYIPTPIKSPVAWDASGRYVAGTRDHDTDSDLYVIYDTQILTELIIGPLDPFDNVSVQAAQWHP